MQPDILSLHCFYHSPLGLSVRRIIRRNLRHIGDSWMDRLVIGIGYPFPFLPSRMASRPSLSVAFTPDWLGALRWPETPPYRAATVDTLQLPLASESVDIIFCAHFLEFLEAPQQHLKEIWRVLKPEGTLILLTPNRFHSWARKDITPFASGSPYSQRQLSKQLSLSRFRIEAERGCLLLGPRKSRIGRGVLNASERFAPYMPALCGVRLTMARKHIYGSIPRGGNAPEIGKFIPVPSAAAV